MKRAIKSSQELKKLDAYELIKEETLEDLKSLGLIYRHKKSGARIVILSNEDDNKVFSIGFRTPPEDSTGVAHIIEHSVLCGSKEFPAKDPFVELVKGSLNTFLNAMTYPDKTIYPVASCNEKDYKNLMHVYMDAVFYPNIYQKEEIFKQEGWHYELETPEGELTYNGVVYNEMKGAFSSPEQKLFRKIQSSLFPDTSYSTESGGDPECIPDLTYQQFLEFHSRYYHPTNSYIYLYGDIDIEERLEWMDQHYLSHFDKISIDSTIKMQKPFERVKEVVDYYSIADGEQEKDKTYLSYNLVIGTSLDKELYLAFQILEYVLLSAPGAPLKRALIEANVGKDILSSYDNGILQPIFSIIAKDTEEEKKGQFIDVITNTLKQLISNGIEKKSLKAAINYYEFKYREGDFGQFPKGLMYGIQILDSWLYHDEKPFIHVNENDTFAFLKEKVQTNYYEELIETYLLKNTFASIVIVKPKVGLTKEAEENVSKKLEAYKASLSKEEIEQIILDTKNLKQYQEEPSKKEDIEKIPMLSIEDIEKSIRPLKNQKKLVEQVPVIHHNIDTNGIAYIQMAFSIDDYFAYAPYLSLLTNLFGYMDTEHYSYLDLSNEINIHTGGIGTDVQVFPVIEGEQKEKLFFMVNTKVLLENLEKSLEYINEIVLHTKLQDEKRLKEIIAEVKSRMQMRLNSAGHVIAMGRASSYFSKNGTFLDQTTGLGYYQFLDNLDKNFALVKDSLIYVLQNLVNCIFTKKNVIISYTAENGSYYKFEHIAPEYLKQLEKGPVQENAFVRNSDWEPEVLNEGLKTSGQVQFVARAGNFIDSGESYHGSLKVLKVILGYEYLWNQIRVKGGAYGCMCGFSYDGLGYMVSYRDPNLAQTNEVFEKTADYVKTFEADKRDMTKYIIGTISSMDTPLNPSAEGRRSFNAYLSGITEAFLQKDRNEVLQTTVEKIQSLSPILKAMIEAGNICVIGNETKIIENKNLFKNIENLL